MRALRVGVTSTRRSAQLVTALERAGAEVLQGPTLEGDVPCDDADILADTRRVLAADPSWLVASSGVGMALWAQAADRGGLGREQRELVQRVRGVSRGVKPISGFRAVEADPVWVSQQGTDHDVAGWLLRHVQPGEVVAVQLHGGPSPAWDQLREAGHEVVTVMPYVSAPTSDRAAADLLIDAIAAGQVDVVTFTSPSAAKNLFALALDRGAHVHDAIVDRLTGPVAVASIGPVTSEALEDAGVVVAITPRRFRTGDLVRAIQRWASDGGPEGEDGHDNATAAGRVRLHPGRGAATVDDREVALDPIEFTILATLARSFGEAFSLEELAVLAWGHAAPVDLSVVARRVAALAQRLEGTTVRLEDVGARGHRLGSVRR